ncbi:hypothetical protein [Actinoplanes sp. DH11]|uniref:hypothetical protein n=1 Tax=Actinoplanes sp. DH11 TaxID=2857011 RepID=UPI001E4B9EFF|nr:hypothetical protein [Actinoplanes sp. DH11]
MVEPAAEHPATQAHVPRFLLVAGGAALLGISWLVSIPLGALANLLGEFLMSLTS